MYYNLSFLVYRKIKVIIKYFVTVIYSYCVTAKSN